MRGPITKQLESLILDISMDIDRGDRVKDRHEAKIKIREKLVELLHGRYGKRLKMYGD